MDHKVPVPARLGVGGLQGLRLPALGSGPRLPGAHRGGAREVALADEAADRLLPKGVLHRQGVHGGRVARTPLRGRLGAIETGARPDAASRVAAVRPRERERGQEALHLVDVRRREGAVSARATFVRRGAAVVREVIGDHLRRATEPHGYDARGLRTRPRTTPPPRAEVEGKAALGVRCGSLGARRQRGARAASIATTGRAALLHARRRPNGRGHRACPRTPRAPPPAHVLAVGHDHHHREQGEGHHRLPNLHTARGDDAEDQVEPDVGEDGEEGREEEDAHVLDPPDLAIGQRVHADGGDN
mmetsp:Transcript_28014/g.82337  ORF Transcript_28014/g.82337 Transcript_28014/m.82337 type:complete len:302 (+) Transcript_28014:1191-2096(+)